MRDAGNVPRGKARKTGRRGSFNRDPVRHFVPGVARATLEGELRRQTVRAYAGLDCIDR
jgi:hypothetical protein